MIVAEGRDYLHYFEGGKSPNNYTQMYVKILGFFLRPSQKVGVNVFP